MDAVGTHVRGQIGVIIQNEPGFGARRDCTHRTGCYFYLLARNALHAKLQIADAGLHGGFGAPFVASDGVSHD